MKEDLAQNSEMINVIISAGIGLFGVVIGIIITSISNWKIKSKESRLRILEKIYDKRMQAHEDFLQIPKLMRTTISTNKTDEHNFFITYPAFLSSKNDFVEFEFKFYQVVNFNSHWYEEDLRKEIFFTQDYFQNIKRTMEKIPEENFIEFAKLLKVDFKDLADKLERKTLDFLLIDIHKINLKPSNRNFEYSKEEKRMKFDEMELFKNWKKIENLKS